MIGGTCFAFCLIQLPRTGWTHGTGRATEKGFFVMLVLSRKVGQEIVLPECEVTITVLKIQGNKIGLGISAPAGIAVHRREVWRRITELVNCHAVGHCKEESHEWFGS